MRSLDARICMIVNITGSVVIIVDSFGSGLIVLSGTLVLLEVQGVPQCPFSLLLWSASLVRKNTPTSVREKEAKK